jgi:hypothetical protein
VKSEQEIRDLNRECEFALGFAGQAEAELPGATVFMAAWSAALDWVLEGRHEDRIRDFLDSCRRRRVAEGNL